MHCKVMFSAEAGTLNWLAVSYSVEVSLSTTVLEEPFGRRVDIALVKPRPRFFSSPQTS